MKIKKNDNTSSNIKNNDKKDLLFISSQLLHIAQATIFCLSEQNIENTTRNNGNFENAQNNHNTNTNSNHNKIELKIISYCYSLLSNIQLISSDYIQKQKLLISSTIMNGVSTNIALKSIVRFLTYVVNHSSDIDTFSTINIANDTNNNNSGSKAGNENDNTNDNNYNDNDSNINYLLQNNTNNNIDHIFSLLSHMISTNVISINNHLKNNNQYIHICSLVIQKLSSYNNDSNNSNNNSNNNNNNNDNSLEITPLGTLCGLKYILSLLSKNQMNVVNDSNNNDSNSNNNNYNSSNDDTENIFNILSFSHRETLVKLLSYLCSVNYFKTFVDKNNNKKDRKSMNNDRKFLFINDNNNDISHDNIDIVNNILDNSCQVLGILLSIISSQPSDLPLSKNNNKNDKNEKQVLKIQFDSQRILEGIFKNYFILNLLQTLQMYNDTLYSNVVSSIIHVLSELVLTSSKFMAQFVECKGLQIVIDIIDDMNNKDGNDKNDGGKVSNNENSNSNSNYDNSDNDSNKDFSFNQEQVIICMLQIASHLARHSEKYFDLLELVFSPLRLIQMLSKVKCLFIFVFL